MSERGLLYAVLEHLEIAASYRTAPDVTLGLQLYGRRAHELANEMRTRFSLTQRFVLDSETRPAQDAPHADPE